MFQRILAVHPTPLGRRSRPDLLRLRPQSVMLREVYAGVDISEGVLSVSRDEPFVVTLRVPRVPKLSEVRFHVGNGDDDHVATLLEPIWGSN